MPRPDAEAASATTPVHANPPGAELVYVGDGDYDLIAGSVVIRLSYDGSDHGVGTWCFWECSINGQDFGGTQTLYEDGPLVAWLEQEARKAGHLPDEDDAQERKATHAA